MPDEGVSCPGVLQLKDLRVLLRSAGRNEEGAALFTTLYRSWCHSVGAVLSLCFLIEVRVPSIDHMLCQCPMAWELTSLELLDLGSRLS